jgi:hypothetical protein
MDVSIPAPTRAQVIRMSAMAIGALLLLTFVYQQLGVLPMTAGPKPLSKTDKHIAEKTASIHENTKKLKERAAAASSPTNTASAGAGAGAGASAGAGAGFAPSTMPPLAGGGAGAGASAGSLSEAIATAAASGSGSDSVAAAVRAANKGGSKPGIGSKVDPKW